MNTEQVGGSAKALADRLLRDVERIAERSAGRMQELVPAYAKVPADVRTEMETKVKAIRDAIAANDNDAIKRAHDDLQASISKIGEWSSVT